MVECERQGGHMAGGEGPIGGSLSFWKRLYYIAAPIKGCSELCVCGSKWSLKEYFYPI